MKEEKCSSKGRTVACGSGNLTPSSIPYVALGKLCIGLMQHHFWSATSLEVPHSKWSFLAQRFRESLGDVLNIVPVDNNVAHCIRSMLIV